jgi:predicted permease
MPFQELRLAVRALARRPGMSLVVVASLALAIGANSAVFSYVSFLLWAEIPAAEPERLVQVGFEDVDGFGAVPFPEAELLREDAEVLGGRLAAWGQFGAAVRLDAGSVHSWGQLVNGDFFEVFGVPPLLGHPLGPEDDRAGAEPVAVLGHRFWRRHLGSDPAAIGRTLRVNTYAFTVVGVMPEEFMGAALPVDLYLPLAHAEKVWTGNPGWRQDRSLRRISLLGRLAPGATHAQAQAAFDRVAERIEPLPGETRRRRLVVEPGGLVLDPVTRELLLAPARKLMAFVGLLLLLACANVANLLVAGITTRLREIGVRTALGAGRRQIVRQFLLESTLLALAGGALGLCVAFCGVRLIELAFATPTPGLGDWGQGWVDLKLDARVLGFTAALCLATGGLAGGLPALRASSRKHLTALLKEAAPSEARLVRRLGVREALVVVQVALSVWLLAGTGLILQSLWRVYETSPGFSTDGVLMLSFSAPETGGDDRDRQAAEYQAFAEEVAALPGVEAAGLVSHLPLSGWSQSTHVRRPSNPEEKLEVLQAVVGPGYFETLALPPLQGRDFGLGDGRGRPRVAVVNESLARELWPGEEALGRRIALPLEEGAEAEVVGVVADSRFASLLEAPKPMLYVPHRQQFRRRMNLLVKTGGDPAARAGDVRRQLRERHPDLAVLDLVPFSTHLDRALASQRLHTGGIGLFALLGMALAALGVGSAMSFAVSRRTREIGVRMALGASRSGTLRRVLREALALAAVGIVLGLGATLAFLKLLASYLEGVETTAEPLPLAAAALALLAVSLAATWPPARRAARVEPAVALKG